ncbi:helix-hairpin-helix domain-containing protein [Bacillus sp. BP-3]|uniref:helix-hairpin-helix domain-containing protein n=1 Tax=Bacillus sp. BP-3 TaxID=3022773 RepID=UPI00232D9FEB|nr:helix-hairpin-helix domain-containing protein [Bacillus sp. BP-3]MDC2863341.1 helix-hairpin-helix domain-containing protein [Bacillus sp. BP-3]
MMMNLPRKWLVLFAVICVVSILFVWQTKGGQEQSTVKVEAKSKIEERKEKTKVTESKLQSKTIIIDTKGAVHREGVYELQSGARVKDAVEKAGGFLPEADVTKVNLAQLVQDQMVIYVPKKGEQNSTVNEAPLSEGKIQINTATKEQLEKISGIGPRKAENIIKYREQHGLFQKVEDLLEVDGIGEKSLEKMKGEIIVH